MNDLVFAFNSSESKRSGCVVINCYICNNNHNKKYKYKGGIVSKVSVWDDIKPNNYADRTVLEEMQSFLDKTAYSISSYQYLTTADNFCALYKKFNKENFYYEHQSDMYCILDCSIVDDYVEEKKDLVCLIEGYDIVYEIKTNKVHIRSNGSSEKQIVNISPTMKVLDADDIYRIVFEYMGIEVPYDSKDYIFKYDGNIIVRKFDIEENFEGRFVQAGFKKKKENYYEYKGHGEPKDVLRRLGIAVEKNLQNKTNNGVRVSIIKNDYDWFDLKLTYTLGEETIELGNRIDLFSNKGAVVIEGNRIDLPESIVENKNKFIKGENGLIIPASNFWTVLQIARENRIDVDPFLSYRSIKMILDDKVESRILDYQREGARWLKWLYLNKIGGCLADDMGVGKTFQTIAFLTDELLKDSITKVLIIVPSVLLTNWKREFQKFSKENRVVIYHGFERSEELISNHRFVITTYATAMNDIDVLSSIHFDVLIFDEIQYVKNSSSKTYKALSRLKSNSRVGLSGTPLENRIDELWNILNILNPGMMLSKSHFVKKYKTDDNEELHLLLNPFILRRTKEDVLDDLPVKHEEIIYSDFSDKQRLLYDSIRVAVKKDMRNYIVGANAAILKGLLLLRQVCCHPLLLNREVNVDNISESCKFDSLKIAVSEIVESGNKVIIYSQFVKMLKIIEDWCINEDIKYFYMDGETSNRQRVIDAFESSEQGVFLISLKAGGVGLNLTSAHYAVIYDPWWNPFVEKQAEDRIHRMGQKHNVVIYKMIVSDSIEEKILNMQESKQKLFSDVLDGISNEKIDLREFVELL